MRYDNIFRKTALAVLAAGALLCGACEEDTAPDPSLDITGGTNAKVDTLRLISYNILEGMKNDRANNFDNFVAWVNNQNPDFLALEETNNFNDETLATLAQRWGHNHSVLCKSSGYPVALTSKYPIELVNRMLDGTPLWHGALHLKVKGINIVVLHLYPFSTYPNGSGAAGTGEEYRVKEINYILDQTIRKYPYEKSWLMMGDFNSYSPLDASAYGKNTAYDTHNIVLGSGYYDVLRYMHNYFIPSTAGEGARIDYIYASKSILPDITHAWIIKDQFTGDMNASSDHRPCILEFRHYSAE